MNRKCIYRVGKWLVVLLVMLRGYGCEDKDEGKENRSGGVVI